MRIFYSDEKITKKMPFGHTLCGESYKLNRPDSIEFGLTEIESSAWSPKLIDYIMHLASALRKTEGHEITITIKTAPSEPSKTERTK